MTETAYDRLRTIASHTDLGAGMAVALKDLEIRGAGNLLGGEQSGHIAEVGFDLYVRLVGEAVAEFKGEPVTDQLDVKVDLPINAHLPHDYIAGERLRLEAYTKIAAITREPGIAEVRAELIDRYGPLPEPVENLLAVARFRVAARRAGLTDVAVAGNHVRLSPVVLPESRQLRLQRLHPRSIIKTAANTILVPRPTTARVGGEPLRDVSLLDWCAELVDSVIVGAGAAGAAGPQS